MGVIEDADKFVYLGATVTRKVEAIHFVLVIFLVWDPPNQNVNGSFLIFLESFIIVILDQSKQHKCKLQPKHKQDCKVLQIKREIETIVPMVNPIKNRYNRRQNC